MSVDVYILIISFGLSFTIYESLLMSGKNKLEKLLLSKDKDTSKFSSRYISWHLKNIDKRNRILLLHTMELMTPVLMFLILELILTPGLLILTAPYVILIAIVVCLIGCYDGHITHIKLANTKFIM